MTFIYFCFAFAALGMIIASFNYIRKGHLGMAVVFGVMAVAMVSIVGALAVFVD